MGVGNGSVIGLTKLFDSGPPSVRWNLVIVAESYPASELGQFASDAQEVVDRLLIEPPFDTPEIACAINIYRLDVTSDEAGADKPNCSDGGGDGSSVDTYFDATFCADGDTQRLLAGDSALVQSTVENLIPEWHQILVIVNDPERGGAGGSVGWTSNSGSDWREVAIHEIGHSAFGLADEYDYGSDDDTYTGGEFGAPNVTAESDPATVKWAAHVTAGSDDPTMPNADCTQPNNAPSPVAAGVVGTFEGAAYHHCGAYRPVYNCMMRVTSAPFCPVCTEVILDTLAPFAVPAPSGDVTLATPTVDFNDVPTGLSVVRAARFDVDSCFAITLQALTTPAAPFSLESPSVVVASPSGPTPWKAYFWLRFTCGGAVGGVPSQSLTLRCLETGEDFEVTLTANCVTRPTVAAQLVFDQSGSMLDVTDEGRTKEAVLKEAATVFVDLLYDDNGIGINAYDQDPHPILDIDVAQAPGAGGGRDAAVSEITTFAVNPNGATAIGDGVELAKDKLDDAAGYDEKAMIVLTDGKETADKRIADVADGVINQKVFAIGMGTAEQVQPSALNALTSGTGGYLLMTGNLSADETFLLSKYYLQILAGVNNDEIVLDPEGYLQAGVPARIPFDVAESDVEIGGIMLARPAHVVQLAFETPNGDVVTAANPSVETRASARTVQLRAGLPLLADGKAAHAGRWHLLLSIPHITLTLARSRAFGDEQGLRYSASVTAYSNLRMDARVDQTSLEPGATLTVRAVLTEYGAPFLGTANVKADLVRPDGHESAIALAQVPGETGAFAADLTATMSGIYRFRILASGRTVHDVRFTREQLRTAAVWHGGDQPDTDGGGTGGGGIDWCEFLQCLLSDEGLIRCLEKKGVDVDRLRRCLKKACARGSQAQPGSDLDVFQFRTALARLLQQIG